MHRIRDNEEPRMILLPEGGTCHLLRQERLCGKQDYLRPSAPIREFIFPLAFLIFFFLLLQVDHLLNPLFWLSIMYYA